MEQGAQLTLSGLVERLRQIDIDFCPERAEASELNSRHVPSPLAIRFIYARRRRATILGRRTMPLNGPYRASTFLK
jgi:hypothetical protein